MMMEHDLPTKNLERQLNEMALVAGRKRQSKQTGFIHLYHDEQEEFQHTIPLAENTWFILALLRAKTSEHMNEARDLLDRLLHFQSKDDGNFPIYLHEYPRCKDRFAGVQLLPAFYLILVEFSQVIGSELKQRVVDASKTLMRLILKASEEKPPSYALAIQIAALARVFGRYLGEASMEEQGEAQLNQLLSLGLQRAWLIPTSIAEICLALQLAYEQIQSSPWQLFWNHIRASWHQATATYVGPGMRQFQQGEQPQVTLYDLYLGYFSQQLSPRVLNDAPFHLQAVLIRPTGETLQPLSLPYRLDGQVEGSLWSIFQADTYAFSWIDKTALQHMAQDHAFHPLSLVWGNQEQVHSFVCQGGNYQSIDFKSGENFIDFIVKLSPEFKVEDREKCRELSFFFDVESEIKMTIQGETASTFDLAEEFILETPQMQLFLEATLHQGHGQFLGHVMRGNRPSQILLKGGNRYKSYDWHLFFRTLRRSEEAQLKVRLKLKPCKND